MGVRIGQLIDRTYRVVRVLGEGGMGAVYEGGNTLIARRVAIKVLHAHLLKKAEVVARFEQEAQAAGRIRNDHINEVIDLGTLDDGSRYIVLEFLEGETLKDRVKRAGRLTPMQAVDIVRQVLVGLSAAHRAGIIHRDLKPGNVFILWEKLGQRDFVKIIDFGVSKFLLARDGDDLDTTNVNVVLGTPHYMAPEQLRRSRDVDVRADLYSVGVILYKAVTGRVPYEATSIHELIFMLVQSDPKPPEKVAPGLDPTFLRILNKAIERDVEARFQSADEFIAELDQWRMAAAADELPYFTGDGLISTMHSVSLRRGSSSGENSVQNVHVLSATSDISEISAISMNTVDEVGPAIRAAQASQSEAKRAAATVPMAAPAPIAPPAVPALPAAAPASPPMTSPEALPPPSKSRSSILIGVALTIVVLAAVGTAAWKLMPVESEAHAIPATSNSVAEPTPAVPEPAPSPDASAASVEPGASANEPPTISVTDLPPESTTHSGGGTPVAVPVAPPPTVPVTPPPTTPPKPKSTNPDWGY
jgi:serine/threonine-protein kinase